MNANKSKWYLPGPGNQPMGPLTADQVFQKWRAAEIGNDTPVWAEGQGDWRPLAEVEPFATAIRQLRDCIRFDCPNGHEIIMARQFAGRSVKCRKCGAVVNVPEGGSPPPPPPPAAGVRWGRWVALGVGVCVLVAGGWAAYYYLVEPGAIRSSRALIVSGQYEAAGQQLTSYLQQHPDDQRALYLLGLAALDDYAAAPRATDGRSDERVKIARTVFQRSLSPGSTAQQHAQADLAQTASLVPAKAPDRWQRVLAIAQLREEFKLAEPKQLARQMLTDAKSAGQADLRRAWDQTVTGQLLAWDSGCAGELIGLLLPPREAPAQELLASVAALRATAAREVSGQQALASALLDRAERHADAGQWELAEVSLNAAGELSPEAAARVAEGRLAILRKRLAAGDAKGVAQVLDRTAKSMADRATEIGGLYAQVAKALASSEPKAAASALEQGVQRNPALAASEEIAWLCIELAPRVDETKRARCQEYLKNHPNSVRRAKVLLLLVSDAVAVEDRKLADAYLAAGESAASELLTTFPQTSELDTRVFALAKRLAREKQWDRALQLAAALLAVMPDTPLKLDIGQEIAAWRGAAKKYLPPELDELAERVEKSLKIMILSAPGGVEVLHENPHAVSVVRVLPSCTLAGFNSDQKEMLRAWVESGGILWASNDVLSLFEITGRHSPGDWASAFKVAVDPEMCPVVTGCKQVALSHPSGLYNLRYPGKVITLLVNADGEAGCSIVPYGRGWISDIGTVDLAHHDGARFWLNFRLFCLGWPIPGAPASPGPSGGPTGPAQPPGPQPPGPTQPPPVPPPPDVKIVTTPGELDAALAAPDQLFVLWVRLTNDELSKKQLDALRAWVRTGGVLWTDTDLAKSFGFTIRRAPDGRESGDAEVTQGVDHPVVKGLAGKKVRYALSGSRPLVECNKGEATKGQVPLLGWSAGTQANRNLLHMVAVMRKWGDEGLVVLRPAEIDGKSGVGSQFESNLKKYCLDEARRARAASQPAKSP